MYKQLYAIDNWLCSRVNGGYTVSQHTSASLSASRPDSHLSCASRQALHCFNLWGKLIAAGEGDNMWFHGGFMGVSNLISFKDVCLIWLPLLLPHPSKISLKSSLDGSTTWVWGWFPRQVLPLLSVLSFSIKNGDLGFLRGSAVVPHFNRILQPCRWTCPSILIILKVMLETFTKRCFWIKTNNAQTFAARQHGRPF